MYTIQKEMYISTSLVQSSAQSLIKSLIKSYFLECKYFKQFFREISRGRDTRSDILYNILYILGSFKMHTLEQTLRQDPAAIEQQDISATHRNWILASYIANRWKLWPKRRGIMYPTIVFRYFADTKQTRVLRYVRIRGTECERKDPLSRVLWMGHDVSKLYNDHTRESTRARLKIRLTKEILHPYFVFIYLKVIYRERFFFNIVPPHIVF